MKFNMKFKLIKLIVLDLLFLSLSPVWASDAAKLNFIGFNESGKYLAFQEYGIADGSALAYATTYFIEVEGNKFKAKSVTTEGGKNGFPSSEEAVRQINLGYAADQLKKLEILTNNKGQQVISHLFSDVGVEPKVAKFSLQPPLAGTNYTTYTLNLEEKEAVSDECGQIPNVKMFTLTLETIEKEKTQVLQNDERIPKSRGCAMGYRIQEVYLYHEKYLVIFLNLLLPGFEGQNMRYLAVTGKLE